MAKSSQKPSIFFKKISSSSSDPTGARLLERHLKVLRRLRPVFLKDLDPVEILERVAADDGLRADFRDSILALKTREERTVALLDRLERSDGSTFFGFVDALRDRQKHLYSLLEETLQSFDSDDEWENVRERAAIPGEVLRKVLKDAAARRRSFWENPQRGGNESQLDPSAENPALPPREEPGREEDEEDGEHLKCYLVSTRGRMQTEKWMTHADVRKDENAMVEPSSRKTYMAVVIKDLVFRKTDETSLPDLVKRPPSHCRQVYVIDEGSKYGKIAAPMDTRWRDGIKVRETSFRLTKHCSLRSNHSSRSRTAAEAQTLRLMHSSGTVTSGNNFPSRPPDPLPPPLPPKPENLPNLSPFQEGRKHPETIPSICLESRKSNSSYEVPPEPTTSFTTSGKMVKPQETPAPPLPLRSGGKRSPLLERLTRCDELRRESVNQNRAMMNGADEVEKNVKEEERAVDEAEDGDDISLNFTVEVEDAETGENETEGLYETVALQDSTKSSRTAAATEEVVRPKVEVMEVETDTETVCSNVTLKENNSSGINSAPDSAIQSPGSETGTKLEGTEEDTVVKGRASPESVPGKLNARDSGVDSVVSQGFLDSPFGGENGIDTEVFTLANSLGELKIPLTDNDSTSTDFSYYEDIDLLNARRSPSIYLDPSSSRGSFKHTPFGRTSDRLSYPGASPDQKVVPSGNLMIAETDDACLLDGIPTQSSSEPEGDSANPLTNFRNTVLGYDKEGFAYYLPLEALRQFGDPQEEDWFYPIAITSREATLFLNRENQRGCFVVYRSRDYIPGVQFILSLCRGGGDVLHYHIVENVRGDVKIEGHDHSFMSVCELVTYFRRNQSHLATRLRRSLRDARLPLTPGYHYPERLEIPRRDINVGGTLVGGFVTGGVLCSGQINGSPVTVKVLHVDANVAEEDDLLEEAQVLSSLRHENIIRLIGVSFCARPYYIVTEFLEWGTLSQCLQNGLVRSDCIEDLFDVCMQVVTAMTYLESRRYVLHRSLTAKNFLVSNDMIVKLTNFERARIVIDDNYLASPEEEVAVRWAAPEVLFQSSYSTKTDLWAAGVVFWEVFSRGERPYGRLVDEEVAVFVTEGGRLERPSGCTHDLYALMKSCWKPLPSDRPSFAAIHDKFKGNSSVYYYASAPLHSTKNSTLSSPRASDVPQLPVKVKGSISGKSLGTPTVITKIRHSSGVRENRVTDGLRPTSDNKDQGLLLLGGGVGQLKVPGDVIQRASSVAMTTPSVGDRIQNSSSDSSSVLSSSVSNDYDKEDLSRGDKIRKSIRKLIIGKKTAK